MFESLQRALEEGMHASRGAMVIAFLIFVSPFLLRPGWRWIGDAVQGVRDTIKVRVPNSPGESYFRRGNVHIHSLITSAPTLPCPAVCFIRTVVGSRSRLCRITTIS